MKQKNNKNNQTADRKELQRKKLKERRESRYQSGAPTSSNSRKARDSFLNRMDESAYKRSVEAFNEGKIKEEITEYFLETGSVNSFIWKKVNQSYYFATLSKIEEIPKLWEKQKKASVENDKFLHFCKPYVEYLPYFLEDIAANANEGFILNKYIYLKGGAYRYLEGYLLLRKYLEKK